MAETMVQGVQSREDEVAFFHSFAFDSTLKAVIRFLVCS